jgi:hypothetical protein
MYILAKASMPMDVEFMVSDTFEVGSHSSSQTHLQVVPLLT